MSHNDLSTKRGTCRDTVFGKLTRKIQKGQDAEQCERAVFLLLHGLQGSSRLSTSAPAVVYVVLVELLRSKELHSCQVLQLVLEAVAAIVKQNSAGCSALVDLGVVTRLADALDGGVANVATKYAVEALHHIAVQLPTCRDLILATTALDTLVLLLKQSLADAHYSMLKEVIWTLLCLADDDPLCKAAIRLSGALPLLVPVLSLAPFSAPTNAYMGLPALAARALRVLGNTISSSEHDKKIWQRTAVLHLARLLRSSEGVLHDCSKQHLQDPPQLSSMTSSQKTRVVKGQVAHTLGAWILAKALLDTHAPLALPTPTKAAAAALRFGAESDEDDDQQDLTDAMLIDTGFLAKRNLDKDTAAAADEALIRVLESGPNSLETVKEAAGALKALIAGNAEHKSTAAASGVAQTLVQLLQQDQTSRLALEAAELLTMLTNNNAEQRDVMSQGVTLPGLVNLIRRLLQASDALSEIAANSNIHATRLDGISMSADLVAQHAAVRSQLTSLKVGSSSPLPSRQSLDKPKVSWSGLSIAAGSPAILTLPNGQCNECAIPKSPSGLAESDSSGLSPSIDMECADAASGTTNNRGGHVSTSAAAETLTPGCRTFANSLHLKKSPGRSLSTSLSNSWVGSFMKRLGSTTSHDPAQGKLAAQPDSLPEANTSTAISTLRSLASSPMSQNQFGRSQSMRSDTLTQPDSARFDHKIYQARHPSQVLLREIVTTAAHLVEGNPSRQDMLAVLGAVALSQDVLMLASKVGPRGGLVGAGADLVRCMSDGNIAAQQAFGVAGSLGQLLLLLQDVSEAEADSKHTSDTESRLVWALHALIDTDRTNQLSFQAAGGIHLLIQLLVQVSSTSPSPAPPPPPSDSGLAPTSSVDLGHSFVPSLLEPSTSGDPSGTIAQGVAHTEQAQLATALLWLMGSAAADAPPNQTALHEAGAVQLLLHEIQWSEVAGVVQGSMFAMGSLVKGNTDIQSEVELQGGIQMLVAHLRGDEAYIEGAAWALHSVVALHPANQGAARQAGVLPPLVGLLDFGPDSITAECAARCLHALVQGSLPNQDAACSAGALMPLLDLAAAGPDQLAAKSAALAISALVCNHTANQDAVRQANGLPPLVALLRGGPRNQAAACAAGALANLVANNGINQDAAADATAVEEVVTLLSAALADSACDRASIEAMKALAALTDGSLPNQDRALQAGAPALLCRVAQAAMQSGPTTDAESAWQLCKALACLTDEHPAVQQACSSAVAPLVALLSHPDTPVQDEACQALACLVSDCPQHQMVAGQAGAVLTLMNLLCDLGGNTDTDRMQQQIQVVHLLLALLIVATQVPHVLEMSDRVAGGNSAILDMSPQQKFGVVSAFTQRPSQEPLILALFALLHLQIPLCKQTADLLQQQTADWGLQHWDLSAFQLSMEGKSRDLRSSKEAVNLTNADR
ncbi:hypothetical protein WJX77_011314 [Trebouxia sp. C0004]